METGLPTGECDIGLSGRHSVVMFALSDSQLRTIWNAADRVPFEKRGVFLERVVARLQVQRGLTDVDLDDAVRVALTGLIQSTA